MFFSIGLAKVRQVLIILTVLVISGCQGGGGSDLPPVSPSLDALSVNGLNPAEARVGDIINIVGIRFGASQGLSSVSINGNPVTAGDVISWSDNSVQIRLASGMSTGPVSVMVDGKTSNESSLTVLWTNSDPGNQPVAVTTDAQYNPALFRGSSDDTFIAWEDFRNTTDADVFAQRLDQYGEPMWTVNGVAVNQTAGSQGQPRIITDGNNGAIIVWRTLGGTNELTAQRINSSGARQWLDAGINITQNASTKGGGVRIVPDGSGGVIAVWHDLRNGSWDVYAQTLNTDGIRGWTPNGRRVSGNIAFHQSLPFLVHRGLGKTYVAWRDQRDGREDIYAQRLGAFAAPAWVDGGVAINTAGGLHEVVAMLPDASDGTIIVWRDGRNGGANMDVYAQRVAIDGTVQWTANGVDINTNAATVEAVSAVADGNGGAIIAWVDRRNNKWNVYAQKINSSGAKQWISDGVYISSTISRQGSASVISDNNGGAIITWGDERDGSWKIFSQSINANGNVRWTTDGVALSSTMGAKNFPKMIPDGNGGAVITWQDNRNGNLDVFAQGISENGTQ